MCVNMSYNIYIVEIRTPNPPIYQKTLSTSKGYAARDPVKQRHCTCQSTVFHHKRRQGIRKAIIPIVCMYVCMRACMHPPPDGLREEPQLHSKGLLR